MFNQSVLLHWFPSSGVTSVLRWRDLKLASVAEDVQSCSAIYTQGGGLKILHL